MNNLLLKNADLYAPEHKGVVDVLVLNGKVAAVGPKLDVKLPELEVIDLEGALAAPGIVDHHNHFGGAGGEGGFNFRTPPAQLSTFVKAGITTAVGLLGTDGISRSLVELLAKARALDIEGLSTWIYTGAYQLPGPTITGKVGSDIAWIDKIIGCKMALSDHRSSHPAAETIRALVSEVRVSAMLAGKKGVVCVHMGSEPTGLDPLRAAIKDSEVPPTHFMPTHVTRNRTLLDDTIAWIKEGGLGDITAHDDTWECVAHVVESGADLTHVCFSSDGNGSMPKFDEKKNLIGMGVGDPASILAAIGDCLRHEVVSAENAFAFASTNPAFWLGLPGKGKVEKNYDADIMVLNPDFTLRSLVARGRVMMRDGQVLVKGTFE